MAGSQFELLGLLTLTGFAFVCGSWLFVAACEAFSHSVAVGLLLLAFAAVLFATAASVALGGAVGAYAALQAVGGRRRSLLQARNIPEPQKCLGMLSFAGGAVRVFLPFRNV